MTRAKLEHVGIIPDGGRRWARAHCVPLVDAYRTSLCRLCFWIDAAVEFGACEVSVYLLSRQNLKRSPDELDALHEALPSFTETLVALGSPTVRLVGRDTYLTPTQRQAWTLLPSGGAATFRVNVLRAYDAWDELELARAADPAASRPLLVERPVDVVLRTAGGSLLSGFLPLQSRYALLCVSPRLFNDVEETEVREMLEAAAADQRLRGT